MELLREYCNQNLHGIVNDDFDCFRVTIFPNLPSVFFWLLLPVFIAQIYRTQVNGGVRSETLPWTALLITKIIIAIYLILNSMARFIISIVFIQNNIHILSTDFINSIITMLTILAKISTYQFSSIGCMLIARKNGLVTSGILHITWIMFAICDFPEFFFSWQRSSTEQFTHGMSKTNAVLYQLWYPFVIIQVFLLCFADRRRLNATEASKKSNISPELDSSFLNRLSLWWFTSIPLLGARKTLVDADLYQLNEGNTSLYLYTKWERLWNPVLEGKFLIKSKYFVKNKAPPKPPSVIWRLFVMFRFDILSAAAIKICSDIIQFSSPFLLNLLLNYIQSGNKLVMEGIAFALVMFACAQIRSLLLNYYFFLMMRVSSKIQSTLISVIYHKTLRLSNSVRQTKTVGEIVNLMSVDAERFQLITPHIQQIWSCPFQITLALIYLFFTIGASAICGLVIMLLFLPLNIITSIIIRKFQAEQMRLKDERVKMCNEVLNGIKVVKLYAWEPPMENVIQQIRRKELKLVRKTNMIRAIADSFNASSPFLVAFLTFATYTLTSPANILTPQTAFVSLTLFIQLRSPMKVIAFLMHLIAQALVANKRIKDFLVAEEINPLAIDRKCSNFDTTNAIEIREALVTWSTSNLASGAPTFQVQRFTVPKSFLVAVVGKVGSGKTTLLNTILGEMEKLKGYIGVAGQVANVSQQPWIQNLSLKDNVMFGKELQQQYYNTVLEACALMEDLRTLPNGDATEIGEKGINLSGGQKARVAIARAVYQNCDIYLFDDPLSAVDSHVGKHIFEKVIGANGLLQNKTRILVTNNLAYLHVVDAVAYMQNNELAAYGSYKQLLEESETFAKFINECHTESVEQQESSKESEEAEEDLTISLNVLHTCRKETSVLKSNESSSLASRHFLQISVLPQLSTNDNDKSTKQPMKLIESEKVEVGKVKLNVYLQYLKSATIMTSFLSLFFVTSFGILQMCRGFWLSEWLMLIDIDVIDLLLPMNFRYFVFCVENVTITLIIIIISTPVFAVVIVPLALLYYASLHFYVPTSRQLRRLESVNHSPIYQHFSGTIQGLICIRAFEKVSIFCKSMQAHVDHYIRCKYSSILSNRWLAIRLEFIGNCIVLFAALFAVLSESWGAAVSAGIIGLSISCALNITEALNFAVRQISELETNIVAVERVKEYSETPTEADWSIRECKPKKDWPSKGRIIFDNYSTRYRPGLDLVIHQISVIILPAEKIGIIGRTGAGKSSFAMALFRMIEPVEGKISIDGIDISKIGLHDLRFNLTIIPQEPVLFSGSLRFNLDPFQNYSDQEIWAVLDLAHLKSFVSNLPEGLQYQINEEGKNISVGQKQLICLARALLRRILDEATAAIDSGTDAVIQETIRREFQYSTVLTIAHRLNTIMDYDRIIVLDNGCIRECDSPQKLLADRSSIFFSMVCDAQTIFQ
ncbi:unnamed protein product [Thelazia callipaeda]|uniref:Multidrug resistance-associated protein 1 n=1 Tax=Thelazia callipaeda TaxID=103827 RepID=A0A158RBH9_THECL|nr:unnamed protein product [Thelazia callipaeda]